MLLLSSLHPTKSYKSIPINSQIKQVIDDLDFFINSTIGMRKKLWIDRYSSFKMRCDAFHERACASINKVLRQTLLNKHAATYF